MNCELCNSNNVANIATIRTAELSKLYLTELSMDINYLLPHASLHYIECMDCGLKYFSPAITGDEKFYNSLQKLEWYYMDEKFEYDVAAKYIKSTDKVLEIGCGKGSFAKKIITNSYVGLEFSKQAKAMADSNGVKIENISIQDFAINHGGKFDIVCTFQVLEHIEEIYSFLKASIKCLKPDGLLIIAVPNADSFLSEATNSILNMPPHHISHWHEKTMMNLAKIFQLQIVNIHQEKLSEIHKEWYMKTLINNAFMDVFDTQNKMLNLSASYKIFDKIASKLAKFLLHGFNVNMRPAGHTMTAVFSKSTSIKTKSNYT